MSKVLSLRLKDDQSERLRIAARRMGRSQSEAASILLEEALRQREFAFVEFRDSPVGRQAYLQGTRLAVWQVVFLARSYGGDVKQVSDHLGIPEIQVSAALNYASAYPVEVEEAINDNARGPELLRRLIPNLEVVEVDAASA
ncbi:MAG: transcriptional regulator [Chloroflexi bacterium]|nr:transcriptional regulator [Chloroflexota bacterium]